MSCVLHHVCLTSSGVIGLGHGPCPCIHVPESRRQPCLISDLAPGLSECPVFVWLTSVLGDDHWPNASRARHAIDFLEDHWVKLQIELDVGPCLGVRLPQNQVRVDVRPLEAVRPAGASVNYPAFA